jgi:hypothetical protein
VCVVVGCRLYIVAARGLGTIDDVPLAVIQAGDEFVKWFIKKLRVQLKSKPVLSKCIYRRLFSVLNSYTTETVQVLGGEFVNFCQCDI